MPKPALKPDESEIETYRANRSQGSRTVGGHLLLTDQRVYFYPHRLDSSTGGTSWACDLSSITTSVWQSAAVTRLMVRCGDDSGSKAATRSSSSW